MRHTQNNQGPRRDRGGRPSPSRPRAIAGVIEITRSGRGFLIQEGNDIPIPRERTGGALSGDIVEVSLSKGRFETIGSVEKIIERKTNTFVGAIIETPSGVFLKPDNKRVYLDFEIVGPTKGPLGHKAIVDVVEWDSEPPKVKVRSIIGPVGDHETEIRAIIAARGFEIGFPEAVLEEADSLYKKKWDEEEIKTREDFRDTLTFTIDPDDAKDFDDAISFKVLDNGAVEVGIHIADVSHFVQKGRAIDQEALRRATSVYLVDRTIPMLPPQLSEDLCSLRPDEDRLTFSAVFTIDEQNHVIDRRFTKGIIRSAKRFTYDDADVSLTDADAPLHSELARLWMFAKKLREERREKGAIMFDSEEKRPVLDEEKRVVGFKTIEYTESHQLIEELMLLANREVAGFVTKKIGKNPLFVYRIHDIPNADKIEGLLVFLRAIGYDISFGKREVKGGRKALDGTDLNKLLKETEGKPEETLIRTATIRSMSKAIYTTKNIGHYGLAFDAYAHFTSPIRRYPDLMVHRTLFKILKGERITEDPAVIEQEAIHSSSREVLAAEAERTSIKMKQVEYFQTLVGEKRKGVVSGTTDWGIFVSDTETGADGMVALAGLTDDVYEYNEQKYAIVGKTTGRVIRLGDEIEVVVSGVNLEELTIDFKLA